MEILKNIIEGTEKIGATSMWNIIAMLLVLYIAKSNSPSKIKKKFDEENKKSSEEYHEAMKKQSEAHTKTLQNLNETLILISSKLDGWDRNVFEELKSLENRMKNYELILRKNVLQYVRLAFRSIQIDDVCLNNRAHDKRLCPYSENLICETLEIFKCKLFRELDLYIIEEDLRERIRKVSEIYVQPDKPIKEYILEMQLEIESILK